MFRHTHLDVWVKNQAVPLALQRDVFFMKLSWDPPNMTDMFSQHGFQKRTTGVSSKLMFVDLKQYMRVNRLNLKRVCYQSNPIIWWTNFMGKNKTYGSYILLLHPSQAGIVKLRSKNHDLLAAWLRPYLCNIVYGTARANMFFIFKCIHTYIAQHNRTLHSITLQITLHYMTLHYITLNTYKIKHIYIYIIVILCIFVCVRFGCACAHA